MGTKNKPGFFDCYTNAEPDEPMFILLGRDKDAPDLVDAWAAKREKDHEDPAKVREAVDCAAAMRRYRAERIERRVQALAPEIAAEFGLSGDDAKALLRMVDSDMTKARIGARLIEQGSVSLGFLGAAIDLGKP